MPTIDNFSKGFGLKQEPIDRRDRALFATYVNIDALPPVAKTSHLLPNPMDQGVTSACVGYSGRNLLNAVMKKDGHLRPFDPSPVWLYRQARELGGYVNEDAGAEIRLMHKAANKFGIVPLSNMKPLFDTKNLAVPNEDGTPIFPEKSIWSRPATPGNLADAERRQSTEYFKLFNLGDMLQSIADGFPFQFGIPIYRSFYGQSRPNYVIPMPGSIRGDYLLGYHAICGADYDIPSRKIVCRNSWGDYAHEGKPDFILSFEYVETYFTDTWTVRFIEGGKKPTTK